MPGAPLTDRGHRPGPMPCPSPSRARPTQALWQARFSTIGEFPDCGRVDSRAPHRIDFFADPEVPSFLPIGESRRGASEQRAWSLERLTERRSHLLRSAGADRCHGQGDRVALATHVIGSPQVRVNGYYSRSDSSNSLQRGGVTRMPRKPTRTRKVHRSAITGRFVRESTVRRHPKTTITQTVKKKR